MVVVMTAESLAKLIVAGWAQDMHRSQYVWGEGQRTLSEVLDEVDDTVKHQAYELAFQQWMKFLS